MYYIFQDVIRAWFETVFSLNTDNYQSDQTFYRFY